MLKNNDVKEGGSIRPERAPQTNTRELLNLKQI